MVECDGCGSIVLSKHAVEGVKEVRTEGVCIGIGFGASIVDVEYVHTPCYCKNCRGK
jgi:hypothetical protein